MNTVSDNGRYIAPTLDNVQDKIGKEVVSNLHLSASACKNSDPVMSRFYEGYANTLANKLVDEQDSIDNPKFSRRDRRRMKRVRFAKTVIEADTEAYPVAD